MANPRKSPSKKPASKPTSKPASKPLPTQLDVAAAYDALLPAALALPSFTPLAGSGVDPALVQTNVDGGLAAIAPFHDRIAHELPRISLADVLQAGNAARGLIFALTQVVPSKVTAEDIQRVTRELIELREPTLKQLEVFASPALKLIPAAIPARIRPGSGPRDWAADGVAIAAVLRDPQWNLQGRHPFTDAHLARMESLANWVLANVKADGAPTPSARVPGDAQERADRFYTLLKNRHTDLRRIGTWLFGEDEVDAKVPRLGSRTAAPRSAKDAAPQPATP